MSPAPRNPSPVALAMEWIAKITTVGLMMVLPGIGGHYLDEWLRTSYLAFIGFVIGVAVGLWQLIRWTKPPPRTSHADPNEKR